MQLRSFLASTSDLARLGRERGADLARTHAPTTARFPTPSPPSPASRRIRAGSCSTVSTLSQLPLLTWAGSANQTSPPPFDPFLPTPIRTTRHPTGAHLPPAPHTFKPTAPDDESPVNRSLVVLTSRPVSTPSSSSRASMASRTRRRSGGSPSFCPRSVVPLVSSSSSTRRTRSVSLRETP